MSLVPVLKPLLLWSVLAIGSTTALLPTSAVALEPMQTVQTAVAPSLEQGVESLGQGQLEDAESIFQAVLTQARLEEDPLTEGWSLKHLSVVWLQRNDYGQAFSLAQQALAIAQSIEAPSLGASALNVIGLTYYWQDDYANAIAAYQQALTLVDNDPIENWKILNNLGLAYYWQEDYGQAVNAYDRALALIEGDALRLSITLGNLGDTYFWAGDYRQAIDYFNRSLALSEEPQQQRQTLQSLGHSHLKNGQTVEAIGYYQQALDLIQPEADPTQEILLLQALASAQLELQQFEVASMAAQRSVVLAEAHQQPELVVNGLQMLGAAQSELNDLGGAIATYKRALTLLQTLEIPQQTGLIALSLGMVHSGLGEYLRALNYLEQALTLAQRSQNTLLAQLVQKNLGQLYISLGDHDRAIAQFQALLQLAANDTDLANDIDAYLKIGDAYHASGRYNEGISYYQQALSQAELSQNLSQQVLALTNLVSSYRSLRQFPKAKAVAAEAVRLSQAVADPWTQADALRELGNIQLLTDDAHAIGTFQTWLTLSEENDDLPASVALGALGDAHAYFGNYATAIDLLTKALAFEREAQNAEFEGETLRSLGAVYHQAGNLEAAEESLREAIDIWESLRATLGDRYDIKASLLNKQRVAYQQLLTVLVAQGKISEALEVSEQGRARAQAELLSRQLNASEDVSADIRLPSVEAMIKIAQAQNATLVEYAETLEALYIWVLKPSGEVIFEQVEIFNPAAQLPAAAVEQLAEEQTTELGRAIANTRSEFGVGAWEQPRILPQTRRVNETLQTLYGLLIEPIEAHLPMDPEARIIFIPQGALFQVPFPALRNQAGEYLIENHTVLTAPSIQILDLTHRLRQSSSAAPTAAELVVGNPVMPFLPGRLKGTRQQLADLPGAEQEALVIAEILNISALTGAAATEPLVTQRMEQASLVHLATHGLLDYGIPEVSLVRDIPGAIALTPDDTSTDPKAGDGLLTSSEIMMLSLQAELVVLSACNTGRGEITADGVIGLSRAFITAGVPSLVVSLWAVPDAPTSVLMAEFYRELERWPDKAQALRQAMLKTLETHPDPVDWAAFTLIGEAQ